MLIDVNGDGLDDWLYSDWHLDLRPSQQRCRLGRDADNTVDDRNLHALQVA